MLKLDQTLIKGAAKDILKHVTVILLCGSTLLCLFSPKSVCILQKLLIYLFLIVWK